MLYLLCSSAAMFLAGAVGNFRGRGIAVALIAYTAGWIAAAGFFLSNLDKVVEAVQ